MSPEAQRIAIAEACGFKPGTFTIETHWFDDCVSDGQEEVLFAEHSTNGSKVRVPCYLNDLNAMHEAESALGLHSLNNRAWEYRLKLGGLVLLPPLDHAATATQRAEAFLRTLGKWEDGK